MNYPNLDTYDRTPDANLDDDELSQLMLRELELSNFGQPHVPTTSDIRYSELLVSQAKRDQLGW
jgi:hypothetical protein